MPTHLVIGLVVGIGLFILFGYELVAGRAYGVKKWGRTREMNSRWIRRDEEPFFYWKIVASHGLGSLVLIGLMIYQLV